MAKESFQTFWEILSKRCGQIEFFLKTRKNCGKNSNFHFSFKIVLQSSGSRFAVVRQFSDSSQAVVRQSSGSFQNGL
jgi:hypothetical protein